MKCEREFIMITLYLVLSIWYLDDTREIKYSIYLPPEKSQTRLGEGDGEKS